MKELLRATAAFAQTESLYRAKSESEVDQIADDIRAAIKLVQYCVRINYKPLGLTVKVLEEAGYIVKTNQQEAFISWEKPK